MLLLPLFLLWCDLLLSNLLLVPTGLLLSFFIFYLSWPQLQSYQTGSWHLTLFLLLIAAFQRDYSVTFTIFLSALLILLATGLVRQFNSKYLVQLLLLLIYVSAQLAAAWWSFGAVVWPPWALLMELSSAILALKWWTSLFQYQVKLKNF